MDILDKKKLEQLYIKRKEKITQMIQSMQYSQTLNATKVFEPYNPKNRELVYEIVEDYIYPKSTIVHPEHLETLLQLAKEGKSCIIMSEHYSNFDSIGLYCIIRQKYPTLIPLFENLIFLAASKLNTEHKAVLAFSESMSRLIIHQARAQQENIPQDEATLLASLAKNSFQKMQELKNEGNIIFMFPSGTRFRENDKNSRQAIEQTASFLKRFDYVCFLGIKGNVLTVNASTKMSVDELQMDTLVYHVDAPQKCSEVLEKAQQYPINDTEHIVDEKQQNKATILKKQVSHFVTTHLLQLHEQATHTYKEIMEDHTPQFIGEIL